MILRWAQSGTRATFKMGITSQMQSYPQLTWFAAEFLKEIFELPKNHARMFLENQSLRGKQNAFFPTAERGTREDRPPSHATAEKQLVGKCPGGSPHD